MEREREREGEVERGRNKKVMWRRAGEGNGGGANKVNSAVIGEKDKGGRRWGGACQSLTLSH